MAVADPQTQRLVLQMDAGVCTAFSGTQLPVIMQHRSSGPQRPSLLCNGNQLFCWPWFSHS